MNRTGSGIGKILYKYLLFKLRSGHRKGRGIHPPLAFDLVSRVIFNSDGAPPPDRAIAFHKKMLRESEIISIIDHGAGSRVTGNSRRRVSSLARHSSIRVKFGRILYRLTAWYRPKSVLEFGTGIGISMAYMYEGCPATKFTTIEGSSGKWTYAREQLKAYGNILFLKGLFEDHMDLQIDLLENHSLVFIDGDHRYEPTLNMVMGLLRREKLTELVIVLDDIHWSDEMEAAWESLCAIDGVDISINLFFMGIIVKSPGLKKQHYNISL